MRETVGPYQWIYRAPCFGMDPRGGKHTFQFELCCTSAPPVRHWDLDDGTQTQMMVTQYRYYRLGTFTSESRLQTKPYTCHSNFTASDFSIFLHFLSTRRPCVQQHLVEVQTFPSVKLIILVNDISIQNATSYHLWISFKWEDYYLSEVERVCGM